MKVSQLPIPDDDERALILLWANRGYTLLEQLIAQERDRLMIDAANRILHHETGDQSRLAATVADIQRQAQDCQTTLKTLKRIQQQKPHLYSKIENG